MLFDLRGRGRRRTIQGIYLALAILMGGGLVLFGIGGNTSGGLLDAFREDQQTSGSDVIERRIERYDKRVAANPRDAAAWAELARLRTQQASIVGFSEQTGTYTDDGRVELTKAERAWDRYLALEPDKPNARVANIMVQALGVTGLGKLDKAVTAMEIVTESRDPTWQLFSQLSGLAYAAGQTRKGDLARDRALELAPKNQRSLIKGQLEQAKAQGATNSSTTTTG